MVIVKQYVTFLLGLIFMSLGIDLIVKSDLGTTPISSLPYVWSLAFPLTLGEFNFIISSIFVLIQIVLLRKKFAPIQWLQFPMTFLFCFFIDLFMNALVSFHPQGYGLRFFVFLIGCLAMGVGVTCQLVGRVVMLPGEGMVKAIADTWKWEFGKVKIAFDWTLVLLAVCSSLFFFQQVAGIREGTLISAFTTGILVRVFMYFIMKYVFIHHLHEEVIS